MKKTLAFTICSLLIFAFIFPYKAFAGWPIGKYRDLVIPSFSYYQQTDKFDNNDNVIKGAPGTGFTSYSANFLIGYGISRKLDFIANVPYLYQVNMLGKGNVINSQVGQTLTNSTNLIQQQAPGERKKVLEQLWRRIWRCW